MAGSLVASESFCVAVGWSSTPGLSGVNPGHKSVCQVLILSHFGQADNPRKLVVADDASMDLRLR